LPSIRIFGRELMNTRGFAPVLLQRSCRHVTLNLAEEGDIGCTGRKQLYSQSTHTEFQQHNHYIVHLNLPLETYAVAAGAPSQRLGCGSSGQSAGCQKQQTQDPAPLAGVPGGAAEAEPGKQSAGKAGQHIYTAEPQGLPPPPHPTHEEISMDFPTCA